MNCPKCDTELEYEEDGRRSSTKWDLTVCTYKMLDALTRYCPTCGYEDIRIGHKKAEIVMDGVEPLDLESEATD